MTLKEDHAEGKKPASKHHVLGFCLHKTHTDQAQDTETERRWVVSSVWREGELGTNCYRHGVSPGRTKVVVRAGQPWGLCKTTAFHGRRLKEPQQVTEPVAGPLVVFAAHCSNTKDSSTVTRHGDIVSAGAGGRQMRKGPRQRGPWRAHNGSLTGYWRHRWLIGLSRPSPAL